MGGSTKLKQEALANSEAEFRLAFAARTKELEAKIAVPQPHVSEDFADFEGFFIRDKESFVLKTKSKDRDKQRLEFVRHVFHAYPVPTFMFNAWKTPEPPPYRYNYAPHRREYDLGFTAKIDYRLWYICIATGGSFYKEYGQALFTKKECHTFLNCQHDLTIDQAIVYAIAYTESQDMGKSLRLAKSKITTYNLTHFWREVIRFFVRQEPDSKETIDDIVDYIVYKQREDPDFTILGKGHTLDSLLKKVETWHQDLRRLKLIGEHVWAGIPLEDRTYTQKSLDKYREDDVWKFTQIKSAKLLQQEGNAMRHCVLIYKSQCISGVCSIWSLTLNGARKLTIEVRKGEIVQVRGLANRLPRPDEKAVVRRWAMDTKLYYRR